MIVKKAKIFLGVYECVHVCVCLIQPNDAAVKLSGTDLKPSFGQRCVCCPQSAVRSYSFTLNGRTFPINHGIGAMF